MPVTIQAKRDPRGQDLALFPGQTRALNLGTKHTAFVGGIGAGKTKFGAIWACIQTQDKVGNGMIIAPTYRMLEDVTLPAFIETLKQLHIRYRHDVGRGQIQVGNGLVFLRSAENPDRLRGPNLAWAWADEAALMRERAWEILLGRLRIGGAKSLITTTPAGFNWVYDYWVDKPRGSELRRRTYGLVQAPTSENTILDEEFVEELREQYSDDYAAQELDAQFVAFEGLIYNDFREGIHIVDPFDIPNDWPRYRGIDFGYNDPFVCLWAAKDPDSRVYFYDEHYETRQLLGYHAECIKSRDAGKTGENQVKYRKTVADHAKQECEELRALGVKTSAAIKKSVKAEVLKAKARFKVQADGRPRIYFTSNLVHTVKELYMYRWADKKAKDEPLDESNHSMDVMRYILNTIDGPKVGVRKL